MKPDTEAAFEPIPADEITREQVDELVRAMLESDLSDEVCEQIRHLLVWNHDRDAWRVRAQQAEPMVCRLQEQLAAVRSKAQLTANMAGADWYEHKARQDRRRAGLAGVARISEEAGYE